MELQVEPIVSAIKMQIYLKRIVELEEENAKLKAHQTRRMFHGYTILSNGLILGKKGEPMKFELRPRNGGGDDETVRMTINQKQYKFTVQRLIAATFQGPIFGYEINHKNRNTLHNNDDNLERLTASENQKHWRADALERKFI